MIAQTDTKEISDYLASAIGIDSSRLLIGKVREHREFKGIVEIPFMFNRQEVAVGYARQDSEIHTVNFKLSSSNDGLPYAPFSSDVINGFRLVVVRATYYIDSHPEFLGLLRVLRTTTRIPKEKLYRAHEPLISRLRDGRLEGGILYKFGTPRDDRLCIPVELHDLKYVPEAEEQIDQGHACVHGETAPYNPFEPTPFNAEELSVVSIGLESHVSSNGYLEEFLEGLLVPADGLAVSGYHGQSFFNIRLKTPHEKFINITMMYPKSEKAWKNTVTVTRRLEEMFKHH